MNDGLNNQQIDMGGSNILDEIGSALSQMFASGMGQSTEYPGYKWDALQGWVPDQGAAPAPPAPAAPKAPEAPHAPMTGMPPYSGPPVPEPAPHAPMTGMPPYSGPMPAQKPLSGSMGQKPRTVIPSQENMNAAPPPPNMFQKQPIGPTPGKFS